MGHSYDSGWNTKPKLDEARVLAPEAPAHRPRKNTRRWCKGKPGREHHPELTMYSKYSRPRECHTGLFDFWMCYHVDRCTTCGKILRWYGPDDCPDRR